MHISYIFYLFLQVSKEGHSSSQNYNATITYKFRWTKWSVSSENYNSHILKAQCNPYHGNYNKLFWTLLPH
jgi:hypothetical protein